MTDSVDAIGKHGCLVDSRQLQLPHQSPFMLGGDDNAPYDARIVLSKRLDLMDEAGVLTDPLDCIREEDVPSGLRL